MLIANKKTQKKNKKGMWHQSKSIKMSFKEEIFMLPSLTVCQSFS